MSELLIPQKLYIYIHNYYIVWKICIEEVLSKDCIMIFAVCNEEHILNYDKILELSKLGWVEYTLSFNFDLYKWRPIQPSIKVKNGSINMVRFIFI